MKRIRFITIKNIYIIAALVLILLSITMGITITVVAKEKPIPKYTIVIDAGHGGIDGGCEGTVTKVTESELNLKVAKKLNRVLSSFGFNVVMTREGEDGLYSQLAKNKKQDDMKKRRTIIEKTKPDMVISIHMNSFPNGYEHGAQTFYQVGDENSKSLADCIQTQLKKDLYQARDFANHTDLYILQCSNCPSVVVEGGFLTNAKDEELLCTIDYQNKLAYAISCGVVKYFKLLDSE